MGLGAAGSVVLRVQRREGSSYEFAWGGGRHAGEVAAGCFEAAGRWSDESRLRQRRCGQQEVGGQGWGVRQFWRRTVWRRRGEVGNFGAGVVAVWRIGYAAGIDGRVAFRLFL